METELDAFRMVRDALDAGAMGVDMGRNIWQSPHPVAMIRAVRGLVQDDLTAEDANDIFESAK